MNLPNTSPHLDECDPLPTGSPNEILCEKIGQGVAKIVDFHFASDQFLAELVHDGFSRLGALHLLNEMISSWADADEEALKRLSAREREAMELACWAWVPFYRFAIMFEEHAKSRAGAS